MKKTSIFLLLITLLFIAACTAPQQEPVEVVKYVVKCWDNSTASSPEFCPEQPREEPVEQVEEAVVEETHVPIAQAFLDEAKKNFKTHAYLLSDRLVIVYENKSRHYFLNLYQLPDKTHITDVYVDKDNKAAVAYCDIDRESKMTSRAFDYERSKCKNNIDVPVAVSYADWIPKGPLDYLEDFKDIDPVLIENNTQTISIGGNSKTIQPTLHYDINGENVIVRIDRRYKVPIKIERDGQPVLDFRDAFFDVMVVDGKPQKITKDWVEYQGVSEYWSKFKASS